jgi:hypothetical protein
MRNPAVLSVMVLLAACTDEGGGLEAGVVDRGQGSPDVETSEGPILDGMTFDSTLDGGPEIEDAAPDGGPDAADAEPDAGPDGGQPLWESGFYCMIQGYRIPVGMRFADGCNDCWCTMGNCVGFECQAPCTAAACTDGGTGTCNTSTGCGSGQCNFAPGCEPKEGLCSQVQSSCNASEPQPWDQSSGVPAMLYCGCDGVTYASDCPGVPYAHVGPCP